MKQHFRNDLNGLRGIAIVAVLLFHAFPYFRLTNGGFIGVDIFFVLSGYLITKPIIKKKCFNLQDFISFAGKRIKRILPGLSLVFLFLLVFGLLVYDKDEFNNLLREILYSGMFYTNHLYLNESSYFDPSSYSHNLLHTWSLAIEAQFYVVFPCILFIFRSKSKSFYVFLFIFFLSFIICLTTIGTNAKFYSLSTRIWEPAAGVICAYLESYWFKTKLPPKTLRFATPYLGLLMIIFGGLYNSEVNSPGLNTLLPVIGTCLIILGSQRTKVTTLILQNKLLNYFGDISYSLYLWHWILLSITFLLIGHSSPFFKILMLFIAVLISSASTFLYENPIRKSNNWRRIIFFFLFVLLITQILILSPIEDSKVASNKKDVRSGSIEHSDFYTYIDQFSHCLPNNLYTKSEKFGNKHRCYQSFDGDQDVAIIGDSHGEHLFPGLAKEFPDKNFVYYLTNRNFALTDQQNSEIAGVVIKNPSIKYVIINSYWDASKINIRSLREFISQFTEAGKKVYLFSDVPDFNFDGKNCKFNRTFLNLNLCSQNLAVSSQLNRKLLKESALLNKNAYFVDSFRYFCNTFDNKCFMNKGNLVLYRDYNHLNIEGSIYLAHEMRNNFILKFG